MQPYFPFSLTSVWEVSLFGMCATSFLLFLNFFNTSTRSFVTWVAYTPPTVHKEHVNSRVFQNVVLQGQAQDSVHCLWQVIFSEPLEYNSSYLLWLYRVFWPLARDLNGIQHVYSCVLRTWPNRDMYSNYYKTTHTIDKSFFRNNLFYYDSSCLLWLYRIALCFRPTPPYTRDMLILVF